jgi:hypothetical protein
MKHRHHYQQQYQEEEEEEEDDEIEIDFNLFANAVENVIEKLNKNVQKSF